MPDHNTAHSEAAKVKWAALTALIFTQRMNEKLREITEKQGADRAVHAFVASVNSDLARTLFCREHVESMRRDAEELVQMAKTEDKETLTRHLLQQFGGEKEAENARTWIEAVRIAGVEIAEDGQNAKIVGIGATTADGTEIDEIPLPLVKEEGQWKIRMF